MEVVVKRKDLVILTERDIKIIESYSLGKSTKAIAREHKISHRTVEFVFQKLKADFKCKSITHLIATFIRNGTIK